MAKKKRYLQVAKLLLIGVLALSFFHLPIPPANEQLNTSPANEPLKPSPANWTLIVLLFPMSGGGTTSISGQQTFSSEQIATVSASASTGYTFKEWVLDHNISTSNPITITHTSHIHALTAVFEPVSAPSSTWSLAISSIPTEGGTTSLQGLLTIAVGQSISVDATANSGYVFDSWLLDQSSVTAGPITIPSQIAASSHSLVAVFRVVTPQPPIAGSWYGMGGDYLFWQGANGVNTWRDVVGPEISRWGFNTVRLAFSFSNSGVKPHSVLDFNLMNQVLDIIYAHDAGGILDFHNSGTNVMPYFGSQEWINNWVTLANYYKDNERVKAFEIYNEPWATAEAPPTNDWAFTNNALYQCITAIRAVDPDRTIVYSFCTWSAPQCARAYMMQHGTYDTALSQSDYRKS